MILIQVLMGLRGGFTRNIKAIPEDVREPMVEVYGLVRLGEQQNIFHGRRNWIPNAVFNYIDLWYFVRLFRFNKVVIINNIARKIHAMPTLKELYLNLTKTI